MKTLIIYIATVVVLTVIWIINKGETYGAIWDTLLVGVPTGLIIYILNKHKLL